jgi:arylsulfatase A-like enzyme
MEDDSRVEVLPDDFYFTDAITDKAITMIEDAVADEAPFFLYLAHTAPHWPLHAHPEDIARYDGVYGKGWDATRTARHETMNSLGLFQSNWEISPRDGDVHHWQDETHKDWEAAKMATYAAMVDRMDQSIGTLVAALKRLGQYQLVRLHGQDWELYDMEADRTELHDLIHGEEDRARRMIRQYQDWADKAGVMDWDIALPKLLAAWGMDSADG